eukprot:451797-Pelagomonas_calceolata.AAC.3
MAGEGQGYVMDLRMGKFTAKFTELPPDDDGRGGHALACPQDLTSCVQHPMLRSGYKLDAFCTSPHRGQQDTSAFQCVKAPTMQCNSHT